MRTRRHKLQVSTFPFLAVLLCAMGALLLVLLVMDRRAHDAARFRAAQAVRRAAEERAAAQEARRTAVAERRQDAHAARQREWDANHVHLVGQEAEVRKQIQSVRDELARAAERLRSEQDAETAARQKIEAEHSQATQEEQALVRVRAEKATAAAKSESSRQALEEMTGKLALLEKALADLKAARQKEEKTYSLVPYNGKRGENRRPVYVECAVGQAIFHPDRTTLDEPLDATAVQAEVERRTARQKEKLSAAEAAAFTPYLMLLVRPDGISTYYHFRAALQNLKIDFGYEFVDRDWVLDFPADDGDAPPPAWTTVAKPAAPEPAVPTPPGGALARLHGIPPSQGREGSPAAPNAPGGSSAFPDLLLPSPAVGAMSAAGQDAAHATGPRGTGPGGNGSGGSAVGLNGPPSPDASSGPALTGPEGPSRPVASGGPFKGTGTGSGGSPGSGAPADPHVIATGSPPTPASVSPPPPPGPGQPIASAGSGQQPTGGGPPAAAAGAGSKGTFASSRPAPGGPTGPGSTGPLAQGNPPSAAPASAPNQVPPPASGGAPAAAKNPPPSGTRPTGAGATATADDPADDPFLRAPPSPLPPGKPHPPIALRPARLSGDRDWIIYVECKPEGVVIYPTQLLVPVAALNRPSGSNPLLQTIQQLIARKQALVRPGEMPYRPEVRFLVRPEAERTYHLAYPTLDALAAPKTGQILEPYDDVSAVVAGH